ncbi:MAG: DegV family EDD domain-containing protein [Spirochaetales bacterium]|nr:DegV family EDD domain-containing protein [Spirochaetales bacterium]MCF7938271.1 DegV family EDD domain-containing protein [Spirochaetales bacterium]
MTLEAMNGTQLYDAFYSGGQALFKQREYLNQINVFPVPDGDTGSNLSMTITSIIDNSNISNSVGETIRSIAEAALEGARGNSGIIFAQFLTGMSEDIGDENVLSTDLLSRALLTAVDRAYQALNQPVEGTMLTVLKDWAQSVEKEARASRNFNDLFTNTLPVAEASLKETPKKLEVLRESGVIDAGALGIVDFLKGFHNFLQTGEKAPPNMPEIETVEEIHREISHGEEISNRYCSEFLLKGQSINLAGLRKSLDRYGDSLIVAGSTKKARVHLHTNTPAAVAEELLNHGNIFQNKVDDMVRQYQMLHEPHNPIALLTDSTCDLPPELFDEYHIHRIPLPINIDENQFLDTMTITPENFYRLTDQAQTFPTTSQPTASFVYRQLTQLLENYESVIAIHLSSRLSGTWDTVRREAERLPDRKISVIDSGHLSGSLGLIVKRAAEHIASGKNHDEVVEATRSFLPKAENFVGVVDLKYMVRGGRVSPLKGLMAKAMNLKPIVSVDKEGNSVLYGKAFSQKSNIRKMYRMIKEIQAASPLYAFAVVHAQAPELARRCAQELEEITGRQAAYIKEISPIVSLNAGKGAVSFVLMRE